MYHLELEDKNKQELSKRKEITNNTPCDSPGAVEAEEAQVVKCLH